MTDRFEAAVEAAAKAIGEVPDRMVEIESRLVRQPPSNTHMARAALTAALDALIPTEGELAQVIAQFWAATDSPEDAARAVRAAILEGTKHAR